MRDEGGCDKEQKQTKALKTQKLIRAEWIQSEPNLTNYTGKAKLNIMHTE